MMSWHPTRAWGETRNGQTLASVGHSLTEGTKFDLIKGPGD
jgi:hypothetical protein